MKGEPFGGGGISEKKVFRGVRLVEQTQQKYVLFSVSVKKTSHCNSCALFSNEKRRLKTLQTKVSTNRIRFGKNNLTE